MNIKFCHGCGKEYSGRNTTYCSAVCQRKYGDKSGLSLGRAWNKGLKTPLSVRNKQSQAKKENPVNYWLGKKRNMPWFEPFNRKPGEEPWNKGIKDTNHTGENHWNWKGGIYGTERHRIMSSFEYKQWHSQVLKRDDYTCQICGDRGGRLEVDHIKPWALYPDLRLELTNGRTLCKNCHRQTDTWGARAMQSGLNRV